MPLETGTYLPDLNASNPAHTDAMNAADAHIRLIKSVLKNTFPNWTDVALNSTQAQIDAVVTAATGAEISPVDGTTSAPAFTFASEPGLGFYRKALNTLACAIAGVDVLKVSGAGFDIITAGALLASGTAIFPLQSANIGALQVLTAALAANAVTYAKLQNTTGANVLLGSPSASGPVQEITMGTAMAISSGALNCTLTVQPPVQELVNFAIDNDGANPTTKIDISFDACSLLDGSNNSQRYFSGTLTVDFTTTGAGGCDVGTRAASKGYYIWLIGNGTVCNAVASLDTNGSPTMPTGYTAKKLAGWVRTDASSNLYRTKQRGRRIDSIVVAGSTNSTGLPSLASGLNGSSGSLGSPTYASVSLAGFISPNAVRVTIVGFPGSVGILISPTTSYGGFGTANPPLYYGTTGAAQVPCDFMLEALSFGWFASGGSGPPVAYLKGFEFPV